MKDNLVNATETKTKLPQIKMPDETHRSRAKLSGGIQAEMEIKSNLPGDRYKNFNANTISEIQDFSERSLRQSSRSAPQDTFDCKSVAHLSRDCHRLQSGGFRFPE